jgi:predicted ATPase
MHLKKVTLRHDRYPTREHYPFNLGIFEKTVSIPFTTPVTFFVGENGTGKSTLLRAICKRAGIHMWQGVDRPRHDRNPYEEALWGSLDLQWMNGTVPGSYFDSQVFRNFSQIVDEWATMTPEVLEHYGGESLLKQSHGQSLMSYFAARYSKKGLYLMDEPETALSPKTQIRLAGLMEEMAGAGHAQFIAATHSPILMSCPGAVIYSFDEVPVREVAYEETEHYRVYRDFIGSMMARLK